MNEQIDHLKSDFFQKKEDLKLELKKSYRSVRKHVREHPEKGLAIALLSGVVIGFIVAKVTGSNKRNN